MGFTRSGLAVLALTFLAGTGFAQESGQWWWEASIGAGQQRRTSSDDGAETDRFDKRDLLLSFALNGYLGDPAVGSFRLGFDALLSTIDGAALVDSDDFGVDADVKLFPRGLYPARLYWKRRLFDFTASELAGPLTLATLPDSTEQWGGDVRLRRGFLRGAQIGLDRSRSDLFGADLGDDRLNREYFDWTGSQERFQHHVSLERRERAFGFAGVEIEDLAANLNERYTPGEKLEWQLSGIAVLRDIRTARASTEARDVRVTSRTRHQTTARQLLDVFAQYASFGLGESTNRDAAISVSDRVRVRKRWELAPFVQYSRQTGAHVTVTSPRYGLESIWSYAGRVDGSIAARASRGRVERRNGAGSASETDTAYGLTASLGHGSASGLRKELEIEAAQNDLRLRGDPILFLPDLGVVDQTVGAEDYYRGRLTLRHRFRTVSTSAWGEWQRRENRASAAAGRRRSDTTSAAMQLSGRLFNLQVNAGETTIERPGTEPQELRFAGGTLGFRPGRRLQLQVSYRSDERRFDVIPTLDSEFLFGTLSYRIGEIVLEGRYFETLQQVDALPERRNRGFLWTITRRFSGWLPVVTGGGTGIGIR